MIRRRTAQYVATLVYLDEPQLILLKSGKAHVVAVAIPTEQDDAARFFAATVSEKDWESYLDGNADLRFLFTYPKTARLYSFDLSEMKDNAVSMVPWDDPSIPEEYLPARGFFSDNHTEKFGVRSQPADREVLLVDGEWDMPEFGQFYQRYSDIYSFLVATKNWKDSNLHLGTRQKIMAAFRDRPFKGGFSYVHFYHALNDNLARTERLNLDRIQYASPGHVDIQGRDDIFEDIKEIVPHFLDDRTAIQEEYSKLHSYLSKARFLKLPGERYPKDDPTASFILKSARGLATRMQAPDFEVVCHLADNNALVAAKIVLSFYRRLDEAAAFFAQGRVAFN